MNGLRDPYGRIIDNLRILVTLRCNYRCIFCHNEGVLGQPEEKFGPEDYGFLAEVASKIGIRSYKISGGEPLLRVDIIDVIREIKQYAQEVSLVTNGSLLYDFAEKLARAGLDRANVSLHALSEGLYRYITGATIPISKVISGIDEILQYGVKVKLNFLAMKSNLGEFFKLLEFAETRGLDINLIELIPLGVPAEIYEREHASLEPILNFLEENSVAKYYRELQYRPVYVLNSDIRVEVVAGYGNYLLCKKCSRLRLTPDGRLKPCLYVENLHVNIVEAVKMRDEAGLLEAFRRVTALRRPYFELGGVGVCQQKWSI